MMNSLHDRLARDYNWTWLAALAVAIIISSIVWCVSFTSIPKDISPLYYLLSGMGQALAAVFALVFTISLVAVQITARYIYWLLQRILPWWVLMYIAFFVFTILYPFFLLSKDFSMLEVRISLSSAIVCVILLVPYFITFPSRLGVGQIIDYLVRRVRKHWLNGEGADARSDNLTIENIAMSALANHDYGTFDVAVRALGSAITYDINIHPQLYNLKKQCLSMASRLITDVQACTSLISVMENVVLAILIKFDEGQKEGEISDKTILNHTVEPIEALSYIGHSAVDRKDEIIGRQVLYAIARIGDESIEMKAEIALDFSVISYGNLARASVDQGLRDVYYSAGSDLTRLCLEGMFSGFSTKNHWEFVFDVLARIEHSGGRTPILDQLRRIRLGSTPEEVAIVDEFEKKYKSWKVSNKYSDNSP